MQNERLQRYKFADAVRGGDVLSLIKIGRRAKINSYLLLHILHKRCKGYVMPKPAKPQLSAKMRKALDFYAKDPKKSKREAYRHGYNAYKMADHVAAVRANELFHHPAMVEAVEAMNKAAAERNAIDASWVLNKLQLLAEFNINKFIVIRNDKAYYDFSKATDDDWYCISEYSRDTVTKAVAGDLVEVEKVKLKAACKLTALKLAGQHIGVGAFQQEQRDAAAGAEAVAGALEKIAEKLPV